MNVNLEVHRVSDVRSGVWCPSCLLPSAIEFEASLVNAPTLRVIQVFTVNYCTECSTRRTSP